MLSLPIVSANRTCWHLLKNTVRIAVQARGDRKYKKNDFQNFWSVGKADQRFSRFGLQLCEGGILRSCTWEDKKEGREMGTCSKTPTEKTMGYLSREKYVTVHSTPPRQLVTKLFDRSRSNPVIMQWTDGPFIYDFCLRLSFFVCCPSTCFDWPPPSERFGFEMGAVLKST